MSFWHRCGVLSLVEKREPFREEDHPRDERGRFTYADSGVPGRPIELRDQPTREGRESRERYFRRSNPKTVRGLYRNAKENKDALDSVLDSIQNSSRGIEIIKAPPEV